MHILPRILAADGFVACAVMLSLLFAPAANAFSPSPSSHTRTGAVSSGLVATDAAAAAAPCVTRSRWRSHSHPMWRRSMYIGDGKQSKDEESPDDGEDGSVMSSNRLSHVMLRVPDVDATVDYWVAKGATVKQRNKSPKAGGGETVFVALGNGKADQIDSCFALEITSLPNPDDEEGEEEPVRGNGLAYLGTSMLLDFQNNLMGAAAGEKIAKEGEAAEPNGIEVRRVASGPGDYFARLCLRPKPLAKDDAAAVNGEGENSALSSLEITEQFYTKVLGMRVVANDIDLLCLRYKDGGFGVSTTLVFSTEDGDPSSDDEFVMGDMLDHLVIGTPSVQEAADALKETEEGRKAMFMGPTSMFGTTVLGITDPNGYTIYLAEE